MITVGKLLDSKGSHVWTVSPDHTVFETIKLMDENNIGAIPVMHNDRLVGIISERDYMRKIILKDRTSKSTLVNEIMTPNVIFTHPDQTVDQCLVMMNQRRIRHMPVITDGKLVGMISMGDVVNEIINDQQYTIHQLENTIAWEEAY